MSYFYNPPPISQAARIPECRLPAPPPGFTWVKVGPGPCDYRLQRLPGRRGNSRLGAAAATETGGVDRTRGVRTVTTTPAVQTSTTSTATSSTTSTSSSAATTPARQPECSLPAPPPGKTYVKIGPGACDYALVNITDVRPQTTPPANSSSGSATTPAGAGQDDRIYTMPYYSSLPPAGAQQQASGTPANSPTGFAAVPWWGWVLGALALYTAVEGGR